MVALANLYTILDVSIQQLAIGLAMLPSLVALAWYVSHPAHRRQLSATVGSDARRDERVVDAPADPIYLEWPKYAALLLVKQARSLSTGSV
jgi:hypothetical protein